MNEETRKYIENILGINTTDHDNQNHSGTGLLISKHICNLMEGNIWFKTNKYIGTNFYFNIIINVY